MQRARWVHELAELGSIDAVLERYPEASRDEVTAALRESARLLDANGTREPRTSPLYRAYNGFMLGLFTAGSMVFDMKGEKERHERAMVRISEFLVELASDCGREMDFEVGGALEDVIEKQVRELDEDLADYYLLALAVFRCVIGNDGAELSPDAVEAEQLLHRLGHPPVLLSHAIERARTNEGNEWHSMMTACVQLCREITAGLQDEPDTCFVALPFRDPYESRYLNFYRGVAAHMQKRSMRAWGGLGGEEHQELLLALIARSGCLMADVTEPNVNVTLEVGFALGQNKMVLLLAEQDRWQNAANIQLDWVFPYRVQDGEPTAIEPMRAGLYFTALNALRRPGLIPSWSARPVEVLQQLNEALSDTPDEATN